MWLLGKRQATEQQHTDFREYIRVESGDSHAKEVLNHVAVAFAVFYALEASFDKKFRETDMALLKKVTEILDSLTVPREKRWENTAGGRDARSVALGEIQKALDIVNQAGITPELADSKRMLSTIKDEITKTEGKEIREAKVYFIYTLLKIEARDLIKIAADKLVIGGNKKSESINTAPH